MTSIDIKDEDLSSLKDKVILITGGSSGIGLASVELFEALGAKIIVGDVNPCPVSSANVHYEHVDVTDWTSQLQLFKKAIELQGRVDHVFANAGITSVATYMEEEFDEHGDLLPPNNKTLDINLMGVIYTCKLGIHYLKKNSTGGSVVITASAASIGAFALTDYNVSKHAVFGLMRGLCANLANDPGPPIRVNALAPMWTATNMVPIQKMTDFGVTTQPPVAVAKSAALLMADESRNAQLIFSRQGLYREIAQPLFEFGRSLMAATDDDLPKDMDTRLRMNSMLMKRDT